jgi:hypothetical protein
VHIDKASATVCASLQNGKLEECNQHADAAISFNGQGANSEDLMRAMHTLKVHVNEGNPKAKNTDPKKNTDASPELTADLTVQRVLSKYLSGAAAKAAIETAYKKLDLDPESPAPARSLLQIARLGFAAVIAGHVEYGLALGQRAAGGKDPRAQAWGEFITAHVSLEAGVPQMGKGSCRITKGEANKLCSVLQEVEQCLQAFTSAHDVAGIHAACRCAYLSPPKLSLLLPMTMRITLPIQNGQDFNLNLRYTREPLMTHKALYFMHIASKVGLLT